MLNHYACGNFNVASFIPGNAKLALLCHTLQGIEWIHVDYFNNAVICDLIEKVGLRKVALWTGSVCLILGHPNDLPAVS